MNSVMHTVGIVRKAWLPGMGRNWAGIGMGGLRPRLAILSIWGVMKEPVEFPWSLVYADLVWPKSSIM